MTKIYFACGILCGFSFGIMYFIFPAFLEGFRNPSQSPQSPQSNFEVIDHYKDCDFVRWSNNQLSEYKYFLHCP